MDTLTSSGHGRSHARVAMLLHGTYPWDERVKREAEALARHGCHVDVICLQLDESEPLRGEIDGVSVHRANMRRTSSHGKLSYVVEYAGSFFRSLGMLRALNAEQHYDLVQVHTLPDFLAFAALPAKLTGAKIVMDIHDLMPELYASKYGLSESSLTERTLRLIERAAIGFSDHVITASEPFRDRLVERGVPEDKVSVVLNTADPRVFPRPDESVPVRQTDRFTVLWHGSMVRRYGVDLMIRAVSLVRGRIPGLTFVVFGEGEESDHLRALAAELGVDDLVEFGGLVPHTDMAQHLAVADLGVVSNIPDMHIDMAYPTKLFEFVQMGLPVLATRTKVLERRFGEDAVIFCDADERSLADGMLWAYENPILVQERAARARAICESISWEKMSSEYVSCIDRTLGLPVAHV